MYKQLKTSLLSIATFAAISISPFTTLQNSEFSCQTYQAGRQVLTSDLTVTVITPTSVSLSWNAWPGAGDYTITVKNLTTNQVEQTFNTSSTSANVSSLNTGDTYRFSVGKNGYVIAEDVIM